MRNDRKNLIVDKTIEFSVAVIKYCDDLQNRKKYVIANQLLRAATSIGANVFEAQNAESKADFVHKMKIAAKEASETLYWLVLCEKTDTEYFSSQLINGVEEIIRILSSIISTSKKFAK